MRARTMLAFAVIYLVWGSTYLAIKEAVAEVPPLLTAGVRHLVAGALLYAWAWRNGRRASALQWRNSVIVGVLFFLVGHGTLHWAEQTVPSGLAALLIATEPIWIAILLACTSAGTLRLRGVAGLLLGVVGVALLAGSETFGPAPGAAAGAISILIGAASWACGVIYTRNADLPADPILRTATTLLAGSGLLLVASVLFGEPAELRWPSPRALAALGYLIVFGSIVAFTAYYWLLDRYSPTLVATHTYVNPVIAVLVGWAAADEPISGSIVAALLTIVAAIALIGAGTPANDSRRPMRRPSSCLRVFVASSDTAIEIAATTRPSHSCRPLGSRRPSTPRCVGES